MALEAVVFYYGHRVLLFRSSLPTAGHCMTSSERPSPESLLQKEASPAVLRGRDFWKSSESLKCLELYLVDVSDIFLFFLLGGGEGEVRGAGEVGGPFFFIENPGRAGGVRVGGGGGRRGAGRASAANWGIFWVGGPKFFFFSGPKRPPSIGLGGSQPYS